MRGDDFEHLITIGKVEGMPGRGRQKGKNLESLAAPLNT